MLFIQNNYKQMFQVLCSTQVTELTTLNLEEIRKLGDRFLNIATCLDDVLEKLAHQELTESERIYYLDLVGLKNEIRANGLLFLERSTLLVKFLNSIEQFLAIEIAIQNLEKAIAPGKNSLLKLIQEKKIPTKLREYLL